MVGRGKKGKRKKRRRLEEKEEEKEERACGENEKKKLGAFWISPSQSSLSLSLSWSHLGGQNKAVSLHQNVSEFEKKESESWRSVCDGW